MLPKRQPDELFEYNLTMFGILDKTIDFINDSSENKATQRFTNRLSLSWDKDIFKTPELSACLTSAELVDGKGLVTPVDISVVSNYSHQDTGCWVPMQKL